MNLKYFIIPLLLPFLSCGQKPATGLIKEEKFDLRVSNLLNGSIPYIGVEELSKIKDEVAIFDAREKTEYDISHIAGATYIGYNSFDPKVLSGISKEKKIILYCSIGYRSEKIGEKLKKMGYNNVFNLYGSIFEWANRGLPLVDKKGLDTNELHTYNEKWSRWISNTNIKKVW